MPLLAGTAELSNNEYKQETIAESVSVNWNK